jgi:O-antigen ligase
MIDFLYTFMNFLQPGVLWPDLAPYRPMLWISVIAGVSGMFGRGAAYSATAAFRRPAFVYLCAFIVAQSASMYYAGVAAMLEMLDFWDVFLLFVVISLLRINSIDGLRRYIWGMIVGSMVIVLYGMYAVYAHLPAAVGGRAGAYGMYENHNDYSFIIIMVLPFIFMIRRLETKGSRRLLLGLSFLACVAGIFLSLSRGGILALVLELILIVIAAYSGRRRTWYVALMLLFGFGAVGYQWAMRAANQGSNYTAEDAESSRLELWKAGVNMVKARPLLGVGSRHFSEFSREYGELSGDQIGKNSHNTYIEVISTTGFVGFLSFLLMLRAMIRELRTRITTPGHEWLDAIRSATLISVYSIMLRGLLDAKAHDWSFYVLCSIAISYGMLRREIERAQEESTGAGGTPAYPFAPSRVASPGFTR